MFRSKGQGTYSIEVNGIPIEVTRKRIKNLYVKVNRGSGRVRVSCPVRISEKNLIRFVDSKSDWILNQLQKTVKVKSKELEFISGEELLFQGKVYILEVIEGANKSSLLFDGNRFLMKVRGKTNRVQREKVFDDWCRSQLKSSIEKLVLRYEPIMNVQVKEFRVKKMKTRWGTCNIKDQRIWLNLKLAQKSTKCLEMVVVHEMVHLLERLHNKRFYLLMDSFMPDWKEADQQLNSFID